MNLQDIQKGQATFEALTQLFSRLTGQNPTCADTDYETDDDGDAIVTITEWTAKPGDQISFNCVLQLSLRKNTDSETIIHFSVSKTWKRGGRNEDLAAFTWSSTIGWMNEEEPEERIMNAIRGTTPHVDDTQAFSAITAVINQYRPLVA